MGLLAACAWSKAIWSYARIATPGAMAMVIAGDGVGVAAAIASVAGTVAASAAVASRAWI